MQPLSVHNVRSRIGRGPKCSSWGPMSRKGPSMAIVRWDPFRSLNQMFDDDFPFMATRPVVPSNLSVDVYEEGDSVVAEMHVAGMDPDKLEVTVEDNFLRVVGSMEEEKEEDKKNYYYKEIRRGSFERAVRLPDNVRDDDAKATYEDGVLKVIMHKDDAEKKHRKIAIDMKK